MKMKLSFTTVTLFLVSITMEIHYCIACTSDAQCPNGTCQTPPGSTTASCYKDCSLLTIANGSINDTTVIYGTVIKVTCDPGYQLVSATTLTCNHSPFYPGGWSSFAACITNAPQRCPPPPPITNGQYNSSASFFPIGTVLTVSSCDVGYTVTGDTTITCLPTGNWSGSTGCKLVDCGRLIVLYATLDIYCVTIYGTNVTITCYTGYVLIGNPTYFCNGNGIWVGNGVCIRTDCGVLTLPYGGFNSSCTEYGTVLAAFCNPGYYLTGDVIRECLANGTWSGNNTACVPVDCGPLLLPNGSFIYNYTTYGAVAVPVCNAGFVLKGDAQRVCKENGSWSGFTVCGPPVCGPLDLPNGQYNGSSATYNIGTVLVGTCDTGFSLIGDKERECLTGGIWSGAATCKPWECNIFNVHYSYPNDTSVAIGTVVSITCDPGYKLEGKPVFICDNNKHWIGNANCKIIECEELSAPDVQYNTTCTVYGTVVTGSCETGYVLTGDATIECLGNGSWSGTITCSIVDCGPITLGNGTYSYNSTVYGSVLTATCNSGFLISGDSTRVCLANGSWSGHTECIVDTTCYCPAGWINFETSCYLFVYYLPTTFSQAKSSCQAMGSGINLLQAETENENTFIKYQILQYPDYGGYRLYWVGAIYDAASNKDIWHESLDEIAYNDFIGWNYGTMECAAYESWMGWSRNSCDYLFTYICEMQC